MEKMELRKEISKYFIEKGFSVAGRGYDYSVEAVALLIEDWKYKYCVTKRLYLDIAKKFETTPSKVERAIRYFKEQGGSNLKNREFLVMCVIDFKNEVLSNEQI